jgi:hypothetical protein
MTILYAQFAPTDAFQKNAHKVGLQCTLTDVGLQCNRWILSNNSDYSIEILVSNGLATQ